MFKYLDGEVSGQIWWSDVLYHHSTSRIRNRWRRGTTLEPRFVVGKAFSNKHIVCGQGFHHPALYAIVVQGQILILLYLRHGSAPSEFKCTAKFRYRQQDVSMSLSALLDKNCTKARSSMNPFGQSPYWQSSGLLCDGMECLMYGSMLLTKKQRIAICSNDLERLQ